jgi:hypothetical protein
MSGTPTRCGSKNFSMTRVWSWLLWISIRKSLSKDTLEGRRGTVNLWSNNKKLMVKNDGLVNFGAYDLLMLPELSP